MATVDLVMPKMGESIMEATILKWHKQPGDPVKMDETVLEIATDKVDSEVPSTTSGIMEEVLFNVNDVVPVGAVIAKIRTAADAGHSTTIHTPPTTQQHHEHAYTPVQEIKSEFTPRSEPKPSMNGNRFYSPLVLNIAASEGVSMSELEKIPGTGNEGRVTKKDILQYVSQRKASGYKQRAASREDVMVVPMSRVESNDQQQEVSNQLTTFTGNVEIIEMD